MKWVLDTNIISYLLRGNAAVQAGFKAARQATDALFIPLRQAATLVTNNTSHFIGLGLRLEDWSRS